MLSISQINFTLPVIELCGYSKLTSFLGYGFIVIGDQQLLIVLVVELEALDLVKAVDFIDVPSRLQIVNVDSFESYIILGEVVTPIK